MAGEAKITKKLIDEASDILKAVPEDKLDDVAAELGTESNLVREFIKNPKSKQAKEFIKKAEGSLQGLVDKVLGRTAPEEVAPRLALPPAATPEQGLVPVAQPGRLQTVASKLGKADAIDVGFDPVTGAPMSVVGKKEPLALPAAGKTSMPSGRPSLSAGMEEPALPSFPTGVEPMVSKRKAAVVGAGGLGLGLAGKILFDKGFSGDETAPPVVKEAGVEDAADVKTVVGTIPETAMPAEQKQAVEKQVDEFTEAIQSFEQRMAAEGKEARDEKKLKEGRLEFMRALETIMHGVVSALGANAMLNRGSPFAIDFSKGPQTDWASEFDRLQKSYDSQMAEIRSRYGLAVKEKQEQRAAAQAASREAREEKRLELERERLDVQKAKAEQQITKQQAQEAAKLNADEQKIYTNNLKHYGDLRRAITDKKSGAAQDAAVLLGADDQTLKSLESAMNQGLISRALGLVGLSEEPTTEQILQGLRPQKPGQAAPAAAPAETEQERKERRRQELLRKARGE